MATEQDVQLSGSMTGSYVGATRDNYPLTKGALNIYIGAIKLGKGSFGYFSMKKSTSPFKGEVQGSTNAAGAWMHRSGSTNTLNLGV